RSPKAAPSRPTNKTAGSSFSSTSRNKLLITGELDQAPPTWGRFCFLIPGFAHGRGARATLRGWGQESIDPRGALMASFLRFAKRTPKREGDGRTDDTGHRNSQRADPGFGHLRTARHGAAVSPVRRADVHRLARFSRPARQGDARPVRPARRRGGTGPCGVVEVRQFTFQRVNQLSARATALAPVQQHAPERHSAG